MRTNGPHLICCNDSLSLSPLCRPCLLHWNMDWLLGCPQLHARTHFPLWQTCSVSTEEACYTRGKLNKSNWHLRGILQEDFRENGMIDYSGISTEHQGGCYPFEKVRLFQSSCLFIIKICLLVCSPLSMVLIERSGNFLPLNLSLHSQKRLNFYVYCGIVWYKQNSI
jgi:hypothetical protein